MSGLSLSTIFLFITSIVSAQSELSLTGTVKDVAGSPVAGAGILLISQERVRTTKSDANGSFVLRQIPAGSYVVEITAPGFTKQKIPLTLQGRTAPSTLALVLRVGNQPDEELCGSHASVAYSPLTIRSSQLSGTVQDYVHRQALRNAEITLQKVGDSPTTFQSHSDASGRFRFENLSAGHYDLRIAKPGYRPMDLKQLVKPRQNGLLIHAILLQQNEMIACQ